MNLSASNIIAGLIFSLIGLWLVRVGKREAHFTKMLIGVALMAYSYFTQTALQSWGIGAALCAAAYFLS